MKPSRNHLFHGAGLRRAPALAACYAFKGDSTSTSQNIDRRIAATDNARVLNLSDQGVVFGGSNTGTTRASKATGETSQVSLPGDTGAVQGISYAETGGASVVGAGNTVIINDPTAQKDALAQISELTGATLDKLTSFAEQKAQDSSVQNKQLAYTAIVGLMALGGIWAFTRKN